MTTRAHAATSISDSSLQEGKTQSLVVHKPLGLGYFVVAAWTDEGALRSIQDARLAPWPRAGPSPSGGPLYLSAHQFLHLGTGEGGV